MRSCGELQRLWRPQSLVGAQPRRRALHRRTAHESRRSGRASPSQRRGVARQYTSIAFTGRLAASGIDGSVGSVGDAYDNSLAESVIGLFKTELIKPREPWRTLEQMEIAVLEYVD